MKKFISSLTSLCMSVSLTAGTLAAFSASTAAADVPVQKTLKILAEGGKNSCTVSAEDIAKGDVKITLGVYMDESKATTGSINARFGLSSSPDDSAFSMEMGDIYANAVEEYEYTFKGGANDGKTITTTSRLSFYGSVSRKGVASNNGSLQFKEVDESGTWGGFVYMMSGEAADLAWLGATSTEFPVNEFTVTLKKGAAAGDYKIDFINDINEQTVNGNVVKHSTTEVGFADLSNKTMLDSGVILGGLGEEGFTITVEGDTDSTDTTTTAKTTTSSQTTTTTVTTNDDNNDDPLPDGLVWKVDEVKLTREELEAEDGYVYVPVKVAQLADQTISAGTMSFKYADELEWIGEEASTKSPAYGNGGISVNKTLPVISFNFSYIDDQGYSQGYLCTEEDAEVIELCFKLPTDIPDGRYEIGMFIDPDDSTQNIYADNKSTLAKVNFVDGAIIIGDDVEPSTGTTATTKSTDSSTTTTTTTTKKPQPSSSGSTDNTTGTVLYGDANDNGKVSIADVVCLNQYLVDNEKYDLTAQGKINAEVDLDGKLTAADSTGIIQSLVKLVTLPIKK